MDIKNLVDYYTDILLPRKHIENIGIFVNRLKKNQTNGDLLQARIIKILDDSKEFNVEGVECKSQNHDVDIRLNGINIQVWSGTNSIFIIQTVPLEQFDPRKHSPKSIGIDEDKRVIEKKLKQLPDTELGILLQINNNKLGILNDGIDKIPSNKVILSFYLNNWNIIEYDLYHSKNFPNKDIVEKIALIIKENIIYP